jgi:hypothetical protein
MRKLTFEQFKMAEDYTVIKADLRGKSVTVFVVVENWIRNRLKGAQA